MYVTLYLTPICVTLFYKDESVHNVCLEIACLPAIMLFFIEIVKIRDQGWGYLAGGNIIDIF